MSTTPPRLPKPPTAKTLAPMEIRKTRLNTYKAANKHGETHDFPDYAKASDFTMKEETKIWKLKGRAHGNPSGKEVSQTILVKAGNEKAAIAKAVSQMRGKHPQFAKHDAVIVEMNGQSEKEERDERNDRELVRARKIIRNKLRSGKKIDKLEKKLIEGQGDPNAPNPATQDSPPGYDSSMTMDNSSPGDQSDMGSMLLDTLEAIAIGAAECYEALYDMETPPSGIDQIQAAFQAIKTLHDQIGGDDEDSDDSAENMQQPGKGNEGGSDVSSQNKPSGFKESVVVNEISKKLLGRYVRAASDDLEGAAWSSGRHHEDSPESSAKTGARAEKRRKGIYRASEKLVHETHGDTFGPPGPRLDISIEDGKELWARLSKPKKKIALGKRAGADNMMMSPRSSIYSDMRQQAYDDAEMYREGVAGGDAIERERRWDLADLNDTFDGPRRRARTKHLYKHAEQPHIIPFDWAGPDETHGDSEAPWRTTHVSEDMAMIQHAGTAAIPFMSGLAVHYAASKIADHGLDRTVHHAKRIAKKVHAHFTVDKAAVELKRKKMGSWAEGVDDKAKKPLIGTKAKDTTKSKKKPQKSSFRKLAAALTDKYQTQGKPS